MDEEKHDPLNPNQETLLYEKLAMEDEDFEALQTIRRLMKRTVANEQQQKESPSEF